MSSTRKGGRAVKAALIFFGIPFIVALGALAFLPQLPPYVAANTNIISAVAGTGGLGVLLTFLLTWFADRRAVRRLDKTIEELQTELGLKASELAAKAEQHRLELAMKQQELDQQQELTTQEAKISNLEQELTIRELKLKLDLLQAQQPIPESLTTAEGKTELTAQDPEKVKKAGARKDPIRIASGSEDEKPSSEGVK